MKRTLCLIGNSSSGIREGAFIGTPCVNVGTRQTMREKGKNVIDVNFDTIEIYDAIKKQISHGPYEENPIYGAGNAGILIANILAQKKVIIQKLITY